MEILLFAIVLLILALPIIALIVRMINTGDDTRAHPPSEHNHPQ